MGQTPCSLVTRLDRPRSEGDGTPRGLSWKWSSETHYRELISPLENGEMMLHAQSFAVLETVARAGKRKKSGDKTNGKNAVLATDGP